MTAHLTGYLARFAPATRRLASVSLECRPALDVIAQYGRHRDVLLYVDPPYLGSTRPGRPPATAFEMKTAAEHEELLATLRSCKGRRRAVRLPQRLVRQAARKWWTVDIAASTGQGSVWSERVETL